MCLAAIAWHCHPHYPLVLLANRDEFHNRPTQAMHSWPLTGNGHNILAGKDLQAGGTWLGLSNSMHNRSIRLALLTNYRDPQNIKSDTRSRGELPVKFLTTRDSTMAFDAALERHKAEYNGFNLLMFDGQQLGCMSSEADTHTDLQPGIYGLSNALLDSPWPKTLRLKTAMQQSLSELTGDNPEMGFNLLRDTTRPADADLPQTGLPNDWERLLSAPFIVSPVYGTRSSYVIMLDQQGVWQVHERTYDSEGSTAETQSFRLE